MTMALLFSRTLSKKLENSRTWKLFDLQNGDNANEKIHTTHMRMTQW